jgi:hypothetical protein
VLLQRAAGAEAAALADAAGAAAPLAPPLQGMGLTGAPGHHHLLETLDDHLLAGLQAVEHDPLVGPGRG